MSRFLKRPDTPDFWRLSEIIVDRDIRMENDEVPFESELERWIETKSLLYMAQQRAFFILGIETTAQAAIRAREVAQMQSLYLDAFTLGCAFQAAGGHRTADDTVDKALEPCADCGAVPPAEHSPTCPSRGAG